MYAWQVALDIDDRSNSLKIVKISADYVRVQTSRGIAQVRSSASAMPWVHMPACARMQAHFYRGRDVNAEGQTQYSKPPVMHKPLYMPWRQTIPSSTVLPYANQPRDCGACQPHPDKQHRSVQAEVEVCTQDDANEELLEYMRAALGVRLADLSLKRGESARHKLLLVQSLTPAAVFEKLQAAL